jgi:hypothetical protein
VLSSRETIAIVRIFHIKKTPKLSWMPTEAIRIDWTEATEMGELAKVYHPDLRQTANQVSQCPVLLTIPPQVFI